MTESKGGQTFDVIHRGIFIEFVLTIEKRDFRITWYNMDNEESTVFKSSNALCHSRLKVCM